MHAESFQALLLALHPDHEKAAQEYRQLHQRLVRFFHLNRATDPHALADKALDRLAMRVADSGTGEIGSLSAFAVGIARHLIQEDERRRFREERTASEWARLSSHAGRDDSLLDAVENCLNKMRDDQQTLLRSYYRWSGRDKIEHHRQLAEQMGLTLNALRNRLMRARRQLDECVRAHLGDISGGEDTTR